MDDSKLTEFGCDYAHWVEEASWAVYEGWDLTLVAEEEASRLRQQVLQGETSIDALRAGVAWVNALDKEAVEIYGSDLTQGEQRVERTARRLLHMAGRSALKDLKNSRRRLLAQIACK